MQYARDIAFYGRKNPIAWPRLSAGRKEKEKDGRHQDAGGGDTDGDQNAELNKSGRIAQNEGQKTDRGRQRAKKYSAPEVMNGIGDGGGMSCAFVPRLLIPAVD